MTAEVDRKALAREYKETPRPAGVYRIHNTVAGKSLAGLSVNLPAMLNRHRFQLQNGLHPDPELQRDWTRLGQDAFRFEVLDQLAPKKEPDYDPAEDLGVLLQMWIDKLLASGQSLYGKTRQDE